MLHLAETKQAKQNTDRCEHNLKMSKVRRLRPIEVQSNCRRLLVV